jgi:hypothetical protein
MTNLARVLEFEERGDARGTLVAIEAASTVPFAIARVYYIYGTQDGVRRASHAHHDLQQVLIAVSGGCTVLLDDGRQRQEMRLDRPHRGLLIHRLTWTELFDFTRDCVLLVLASQHYDEADYIRDYDAFVGVVRSAGA